MYDWDVQKMAPLLRDKHKLFPDQGTVGSRVLSIKKKNNKL